MQNSPTELPNQSLLKQNLQTEVRRYVSPQTASIPDGMKQAIVRSLEAKHLVSLA